MEKEIISKINELVKKSEKEEYDTIVNSFKTINDECEYSDELKIIGLALSLYLNNDDINHPFAAYNFSLDDFTDEGIHFIEEVFENIESDEVKARLADILWLKKRKIEYAKIAIYSYISQAKKLEDFNNWVSTYIRIERALILSSFFKRKDDTLFNFVIAHIEDVLKRANGSDPLLLSAKLMRLLIRFKQGDFNKYYEDSKKIAEASLNSGNYDKAKEHYLICIDFANLLGDKLLIQKSTINQAECYATSAISIATSDSILAAHWMQQAVETYKQVKGGKERKDELYTLLIEYQKNSVNQMKEILVPFDVSEQINHTIDVLEGKNFIESLIALTYKIIKPPSYERLEKNAKNYMSKFVFTHLMGSMGSTYLDKEGKVIAKTPANSNGGKNEKTLWSEIVRLSSIEHLIMREGAIKPGREYILTNVYTTEYDFLKVCLNNPFIQKGQELLFAKGLYAGFIGDFIVSTQFLVPLLENSLRYVLSNYGVNVSSINNYGVQEEMRLPSILEHEKSKEIFGKDLLNDLKILLIERRYGNLRNVVAHGLTTTETYFQYYIEYFWWLILRLCLFSIFDKTEVLES